MTSLSAVAWGKRTPLDTPPIADRATALTLSGTQALMIMAVKIDSVKGPIMSAEDWLRVAKTKEKRLLGEIAKTDLFRQLEAVRAVLAVYQGKQPSPEQANGLASELGSESTRIWKVAS